MQAAFLRDSTPHPPPLLSVAQDVQAAADFYRDKLGFTIEFLHGQPTFYASVSRDEACIHLRFVHQPMYVAGLREKEQVIAAFLSVANVKGLFTEYQTRKVPFVHRLKKEPWGQSPFIVSDPDGNALCFGRMNSSQGFCAWSRGPIRDADAPLSADRKNRKAA